MKLRLINVVVLCAMFTAAAVWAVSLGVGAIKASNTNADKQAKIHRIEMYGFLVGSTEVGDTLEFPDGMWGNKNLYKGVTWKVTEIENSTYKPKHQLRIVSLSGASTEFLDFQVLVDWNAKIRHNQKLDPAWHF